MSATAVSSDKMFARAPDAVTGGEDVGPLGSPALVGSLFRLLGRGSRLTEASAGLALQLARIALGRSDVEAGRGDWRFADPAWQEHPGYRRAKQSYLAWAAAVVGLAEDSGLPWRDEERARFALTVLTSAAAPTNFFLSNPAAVKRAYETAGLSVLRGTRNLARDWRTNGGMPRQVDDRRLKLGVNLAVTPGAVVYRDERCEIIQYGPSTPEVHETPVVIVPPQINKFYFLDLAPGRSFVEYIVSRGLQVFMVSWRNPTRADAGWGLDEYASSVLTAIDVARTVTASGDANLFGFCAGGITAAVALNHLAANGDRRVRTASFAVTLLDFDVPGMLGMLAEPGLLRVSKWASHRAGVLGGRSLGAVFSWFRPDDLIWNYYVNNYLLGNDPPVFDILAWNADSANLPASLHQHFLDIFGENALCTPGRAVVLGSPVDLNRIKVETYVTAGTTDHLTPWKGCYRTTNLLGGPSTFVLSNAGHIQSLVNPPGNPKAFYFTGGEPGSDPDAWKAGSSRQAGSWWEHWSQWALARSGPSCSAPSKLGSRAHRPLADVPGAYVLERI